MPIKLEKIDNYRWLIPKTEGMRVPGLIYANEKLLKHVNMEETPRQVMNVAWLPGIVKYSLAMPDIHWGYGFPIGGVAGIKRDGGVVSPGGVGYDINCGVRILSTNLKIEDVKPRIKNLLNTIYEAVPCGIGTKGRLRLSQTEIEDVLVNGVKWMVKNGLGRPDDIVNAEEGGCIEGADPTKISKRAYERGRPQLGTLGAGNHFLEIQVVDEVYDEEVAEVFGIKNGSVTCMIHTGSRGFGYQVCDDYLRILERVMERYHISVPDRELACAPIDSKEGSDYIGAMRCAANYAWANRQAITHWVRESFSRVFGKPSERLGLDLVYDVAHNIAKFEKHKVDGKTMELCVHRKGATRAFPPGHPDIPEKYRKAGQPVLIPGDMGTHSYILVGTEAAMNETFGSTCHGAGRVMSRHKAIKAARGREIVRELEKDGITVKARSHRTLMEEMPDAYKNIDDVVETCQLSGISKKVARMRPIGVVKG